MAAFSSVNSISNLWGVLTLFLIPIGGGIPAGVILAKSKGVQWPVTAILYLISDIILACIFEPLMLLIIQMGKRSPKVSKFSEAFKLAMKKTTAHYGTNLGPLALITVSFGVDPMTGRTVAKAAGHGFISGWILAITGDMFYFAVIMISTLWLNHILGDGTATTFIILALMIVVPIGVRRFRDRKQRNPARSV